MKFITAFIAIILSKAVLSINGDDVESVGNEFAIEMISNALAEGILEAFGEAFAGKTCLAKTVTELNTCYVGNAESCTNCMENHPHVDKSALELGSISQEVKEICPEMKEFFIYCGCDACEAEKTTALKCLCEDEDTSSDTGITSGSVNDNDTSINEVNFDLFTDDIFDSISIIAQLADGITEGILEGEFMGMIKKCADPEFEAFNCFDENENEQECSNCRDNHPQAKVYDFGMTGSGTFKEEMTQICPEVDAFYKYCGCDVCEAEKSSLFECICNGFTSGSRGIQTSWISLLVIIIASFMY